MQSREDPDSGGSDAPTLTTPLREKPWYSLSGLRIRLTILVVITLLPAFALTLYSANRGRTEALQEAERHGLALAHQAANQEKRAVDNAKTGLRILTATATVRAAKYPCRTSTFRDTAKLHGIAALGVANIAGQVQCSITAVSDKTTGEPRLRHSQKRVASNRLLALGYRRARAPRNAALIVLQPIAEPGDQVKRMLFARVRVDWLKAIAANSHLPRGSLFSVIDSHGRVFTRYFNGQNRRSAPVEHATEAKRLLAGDDTWVGTVHSGTNDWLVTDIALGHDPALQGLRAIVAIPATVAYAAVNSTLHRDLTVLSAVGLISLLLAWLLGERLVLRPVQNLAAAAHRIASGDTKVRARVSSGPDEIRNLGRAFDYMASSLERHDHHVHAQSERIARLNRILQVLSAINAAIIRIRDRDQLLQETCRIAVELGKFPFAWIGFVEPGETEVRPVAHAGGAHGFVKRARVTINPEEPEGAGVIGEAIRSGKHVVSNDVEKDPRLRIRLEDFRKLKVHSAAAFPLRIQSRVVGVLALNAAEPGFFDSEELALLDELAADTSLGLEQIEKDRQLNYLAYWDPLTNLPNRTLLEDRLRQSLYRAERFGTQVAVICLGLVGFARINATMGRAAGDQVLLAVAARLSATVRKTEPLANIGSHIARLGSHEFALVLDDIDSQALINEVADRIIEAMDEPVALEDGEAAISQHMGISIYPEHGSGAEDLLNRAQFAAHSQREEPVAGLAFYSPEKDTQAKARYALEADLRHAIDNQDFYLEYQPRVHAGTGRVIGAEALLRWNRPGHGRVPPDQFIPVLEETGLIGQVGEWVARTAFAQRWAWRQLLSETFVVSINASSHELRTPDYVSRIRRVRQSVGVPAQWLEIEITETGLLNGGNATMELLATLKDLGFRLSVDDFGTGYCSLSYLRQFPVDILKVDKSFINDIVRDEGALVIVRSILALAGAMKLTVVAEGVETEAQMRLLAQEGCDEIQGYFFSRPVAAKELPALIGRLENKRT